MSVFLAQRSRTAHTLSVCVTALAALSLTAQIAKVYFAYTGHRSLRFTNHTLVTPHNDLTYFNVPLTLTYTADILLWLLALSFSIASTTTLKRHLAS
ncbi:hypothetical protein ACIBCN_35100 [Nocardia sp. NPDC051052]|uniref:hypothetical protein n=1 Tax=Nocardia sp. NPDC051052 TaxID=3364322 RepID=UPI0037BA9589